MGPARGIKPPSPSLPSLLSSLKALQVRLDLPSPENKQPISAARLCLNSGGLCSSRVGGLGCPSTPRPHGQRSHTPASQAPYTSFPFPSLPAGALGSSPKVLHQQNSCTLSYQLRQEVVLGISRRSPICTHRVPRSASSTSCSRSSCFSCQARLPGDAVQPPRAGNTLQGQKAT